MNAAAEQPTRLDVFLAELDRVLSTTSAAPTWWMLLITVGTGVLLTMPSSSLRQTNLVGLIAHEFGHALAALLTGGRVLRIELSSPYAGITHHESEDGLPNVVTGFAGYAAPPLAGLGVAALIADGSAAAALGIGVGVALMVLFWSRDVVTILLVLVLGGLLWLLLWTAPTGWQLWAACALMGLLLTHSAVRVPQMVAERARGEDPDGDDAEQLHDATGVPGILWLALWAALIAWCWWTAYHLLM